MQASHRVLGACLICLIGSTPVQAAPRDKPQKEASTARAHYEEAVKFYDLGEFREALREFKEAYRVKPDPALLFNIGQTYWKLGDYEAAVHSYQAYLRHAGRSPAEVDLEARIRDLKEKIARGESRPFDAAAPRNARPLDADETPEVPRALPSAETARPEPATTTTPATLTDQRAADESSSTPRWIWWAAGAAAVVGVVALGLILAQPEAADPVRGNVEPGIVNLSP